MALRKLRKLILPPYPQSEPAEALGSPSIGSPCWALHTLGGLVWVFFHAKPLSIAFDVALVTTKQTKVKLFSHTQTHGCQDSHVQVQLLLHSS